MWNVFRKILGIKYLVNKSTGEVHKLSNVTGACGVDKMAKKNKQLITENKFQKMISKNSKVNGCVHCFKDKDTD